LKDIFIYDFLEVVKLCQEELARLFIDRATAYNKEDFPRYNELISLQCSDIPLHWKELPGDSRVAHLIFDLSLTTVYTRCYNNQNDNYIFVTQQDYHCLQDNIEKQFSSL